MSNNVTRRKFLATAGATASGFLCLPGDALGQPGSVRTRRSVFSLTAPIADYRTGVGVMKTRSATDPTSWIYQANMHGTYTAPPAGALWNQCQHGSFFFLSWHRMYLYFFERIVRKACGNNAFALPYWNYTSQTLSARQLPLAFRQPTFNSSPNPLYDAARNTGINSTANPAALSYSATLFSTAFGYTNFASAGGSGASFGGQTLAAPAHFAGPHGQLESQPHDIIHGLLGGSGDMGDPNRAARDPIFWLHHANIDRLWKRWLQQGGGRVNPTANNAWMTHEFEFYDENGHKVKLKGSDVLNTVTQLQYRYDDDPVTFGPAAFAVSAEAAPPKKENPVESVAVAEQQGIALGTRPVRVAVTLKEPAKKAVARALGAAAVAADNPITLHLDDVAFDKQPGIYYEVYLNVPADEDNPEFHNGHFVGNLGFFAKTHEPAAGADPHAAMTDGGAKQSHVFDITGLVRELSAEKKWDPEKATITFIPRGLEDSDGHPLEIKTDAKIKVGKVSFQSTKE
ncbi:MAG TPA: tyrosinase family protein [Gemmataceae bacterium]|nr:tyrosinase family protein [Gemmataceae bacterium]